MTWTVRVVFQRSAFAAAFLSFAFPGLGQAYAGRYRRALLFAIVPLLLTSAAAALLISYGPVRFALWVGQTSVLGPLAAVNLLILAYRAMATLDAYHVAFDTDPDPLDQRGWSLAEPPPNPISLAGLVAVLVVLAAGHALIGYWDLRFYGAAARIHSPVLIVQTTAGPSVAPDPTPTFPPQMTFAPQPMAKAWDQKGRLNVLLVGVDQQDGGFRTDSMIVASIDPATHQVALFSMPRDTVGLPMPPNSALYQLWGPVFPYKLNALWKYSDIYRSVFPGGGVEALKQALGYTLFGRTDAIPYYVLVNFNGFKDVIDTLGGVRIDVPAPVIDNGYPGEDGQHFRVYIPAGIQQMNGQQALTYARSRKGSGYYNDYDRSARQEQILVALEQQADMGAVSSHLGDLIDALSASVHTDIPQGPDVLGALIDQARYINRAGIKTYAFSPSGYGNSGLDLARVQATVKAATADSPADSAFPGALQEQAPIAVESGSGDTVTTGDLVAHLQSLGLNAQVGSDRPQTGSTKLLIVNGADTLYPQTLALLEQTLGLAGAISTDGSTPIQGATEPGQTIGFVVITGPDATVPTP